VLILTRKKNQRIVCSNGMVILITEISDGKVRLGFDAPPDIRIWREELWPSSTENQDQAETRNEDGDGLQS